VLLSTVVAFTPCFVCAEDGYRMPVGLPCACSCPAQHASAAGALTVQAHGGGGGGLGWIRQHDAAGATVGSLVLAKRVPAALMGT